MTGTEKNNGWKTLFPAAQWLPESACNMRVRGAWQGWDCNRAGSRSSLRNLTMNSRSNPELGA